MLWVTLFFLFNLCSKFEYIQKNNRRKLSSFSTLTHKKYDVIKIEDIIHFNCVGGEILNKFLSKIVVWAYRVHLWKTYNFDVMCGQALYNFSCNTIQENEKIFIMVL